MTIYKKFFIIHSTTAFFLCKSSFLPALTTLNVTTNTDSNVSTGGAPGELRYVLNTMLNTQAQGLSGSWQINFNSGLGTIALNGILPMLNLFAADTITFTPSTPVTIDGSSLYRGFFVRQGNVTFQNMTIQHCLAQGGAGGNSTTSSISVGGGGGMGAGGALFIDQATVNLQNVQFSTNQCQGGVGGMGGNATPLPTFQSAHAAGGGGMGGAGGTPPPVATITTGGGGGGFVGNGGNGGSSSTPLAGAGGGGGGGMGNGGNGVVEVAISTGGGGGGGAIVGANGGNAPNAGTAVAGFVFGGGGGGANQSGTQTGGSGGGTSPGTGALRGGGGGGGFNGSSTSSSNGGQGGQGGGGGSGGSAATAVGCTGGNGGPGGGGGGGGAAGRSNLINTSAIGGSGGYGGGSGGAGTTTVGVNAPGGFGGGGGGAGQPDVNTVGHSIVGGAGGFGGGGGGGVSGGNGGFGGGGGAAIFSFGQIGVGGSGGGNASQDLSTTLSAGGGAGLGSVLFINNGGILNILSGNSITGTNTATGGAGGDVTAGSGIGAAGLFLVSGAHLNFPLGPSDTLTINDVIADDSPHTLTGAGNSTVGTGSGSVITLNSAGTLVLTAQNLYAGGTVLNAGTLQITTTDSGTSGPLGLPTTQVTFNGGTLETAVSYTTTRPVVLTGPGTVQVDPTFTSTFAGFSGPGSFTKSGAGTLIFSTDNFYTGNTFITGGSLQPTANDSFIFSPLITVSSGGTFNVNGTTQLINGLAGDGAVALGSGQLTLNNVANNSFSGSMTGTGTFIKEGPGAFSTSGSFNLTGASSLLQLEEGVFTIDGTAAANAVKILGGTLKGTGTITSTLPLQVSADAGLSPGDPVGAMHIIGDVIFSDASFLSIEVTPTTASELFATGTIDVTDATLVIMSDPGTYTTGMIYNIVSAPSVLGPFDGVEVTPQSAVRNFSVIYSPDLIQLGLTIVPFSNIIGTSCNSNAAATASGFESISPPTADSNFITTFLNEAGIGQIECDFDQMHLALFNAIPITQESVITAIQGIFTDRLQEVHGPYCAYKPWDENPYEETAEQEINTLPGIEGTSLPERLSVAEQHSIAEPKTHKKGGLWIAPFGNFERQQSRLHQGQCDQTRIGFHSSTWGVIAAIDEEMDSSSCDQILLGASLSYAHTDLNWKHGRARSEAHTGLATLYTTFYKKHFYLDAILLGGMAYFEARRHILLQNNFGQLTRAAHHHNNAGQFEGHVEMGTLWNPWCMQFRAYGSFDYVYLRESSYREKGAQSLNLSVDSRSSKLLREELGVSFSARQSNHRSALSEEIRLAYVREERFRGKEMKLHFVNSSAFEVEGFLPNRNLFAPTATLKLDVSTVSFSLTYSGEFGIKWSNQTVNAKLLWNF